MIYQIRVHTLADSGLKSLGQVQSSGINSPDKGLFLWHILGCKPFGSGQFGSRTSDPSFSDPDLMDS